MKKILSFIKNNILFILSLFLLAFIPLYPKIPIIDIKNTWVYIRLEDFVVLFVLFFWVALLYLKKISFKTPLTLPILIFWAIGVISTLHGILLIFPTLANVFPNVAFLSLLRHIEYMSLFFISYQGMKEKKFLPFVISTLVLTLLLVTLYGFGQKYLGFPAYLTMNEEFAKGIPIQLSNLSRVPSTFAGHYDLAAYLVLIIPIVVSIIFGIKNFFLKLILSLISVLGFVLLFMTVSRVSFFVIIISLFIVLFFQKRKLVLLSVPILLAFAVLIVSFQTSLFDRFQSTVKEIDVLVDAKTGESVGHVKFVEKEYFENKIVLEKNVRDREELSRALTADKNDSLASPTAVLEYEYIPKIVPLVSATNISTGESLPQGTGYINLSLSPVTSQLDSFFYEFPPELKEKIGADELVLHGDFLIKRAAAYDLSFTTRFQGEWPNALKAFNRNVFLGSGYGSVSLAVDNNYLRILGETGLLGLIAFLVIFITLGIYVKKIWPDIDSKLSKSFVLGFVAGVIGLALNATLIDVFEASKIAFVLWILMGIAFALLSFYKKQDINLGLELRKIALSTWAIALYLLAIVLMLFSASTSGFFIGDDFTWLRWASDSKQGILSYFTNSDGFFYRPGTKIYFLGMYNIFWLNQAVYHIASVSLHFLISVLVFILGKKIFGKVSLAFIASLLLLILSGPLETVYWISSTGHLFTIFFGLLGLLLFISWQERKKAYLYVLSFISFGLSPLFHELGVVLPLLVLCYQLKDGVVNSLKNTLKKKSFLCLFIPVIVYLVARYLSSSHWFSGDYSYNLVKLPLNFVGNSIGYIFLTLLGPIFLSPYEGIRAVSRVNVLPSIVVILIVLIVLYYILKAVGKVLDSKEKGIIAFGSSFFIVSLLPFIGLGNITSRYSYLASIGLIFILVVFLKKLYLFLLTFGKQIALATMFLVISIYSMFHIIQLKQTSADFLGAGEKTKQFFVSLDSLYLNNWKDSKVKFNFIDVPIKYGDAWVFPVGLEDAVYLSFRNENAIINKYQSLEEALSVSTPALNNKILIFNEDGSLTDYLPFEEEEME